MRDYTLKRSMENLQVSPAGLNDAIVRAKASLLNKKRLNAYRALDPANGRMRGLMADVFEQRLEQNLWIPPALPYYCLLYTSRCV